VALAILAAVAEVSVLGALTGWVAELSQHKLCSEERDHVALAHFEIRRIVFELSVSLHF
jgi:hypothetical protein